MYFLQIGFSLFYIVGEKYSGYNKENGSKTIENERREKFIRWSADLDLRYDRVFSIIDIQEKNM